jgi:hypothetical protein
VIGRECRRRRRHPDSLSLSPTRCFLTFGTDERRREADQEPVHVHKHTHADIRPIDLTFFERTRKRASAEAKPRPPAAAAAPPQAEVATAALAQAFATLFDHRHSSVICLSCRYYSLATKRRRAEQQRSARGVREQRAPPPPPLPLMAERRKSDGSGASRPSEPAVQIRGFHVEGQHPQQLSPNALLQEMRGKGGVTAGSPAPVIVPPSFQVRSASS